MMPVDTLPGDWSVSLECVADQPQWQALQAFLGEQEVLLPPREMWFNALETTPLSHVKVVILGQDPYPTPGHAHGLSFSVLPEVRPYPKSLINIFKELQDDLGIVAETGCLQAWAKQGVLLLNTVLTVAPGKAGSHQRKGWELLTDALIEQVNAAADPCVFILWGAHAQKKRALVDEVKHRVIASPHPSPLSAYRGFFGSKPFSQANDYLESMGRQAVDWRLTAPDLLSR